MSKSAADVVGHIYPGAHKHDASELKNTTDSGIHIDDTKAKKSPRDNYDPAKSVISHDAMNIWLKEAISGELTQIPGIGDVNANHLRNCSENITSSYQLMGKFLLMRGMSSTQVEQCDRFFAWLKDSAGIHYGRNSIVQAVATKMNIFFPGLYNEAAFADMH